MQIKAADYGLDAVELFVSSRRAADNGGERKVPCPDIRASSTDLARDGFDDDYSSVIEDLGKQGEIVRSAAPVFDSSDPDLVTGVVVVSYYIPQNLANKADGIPSGYEQYRSSLSGKEPIKLSYRLGFLTVTLALLLAAIWVALRVAAGITVPISKLVEGTAAVASGRLDYQIDETTGDEVGVLIDSFNKMTRDLNIPGTARAGGLLQADDPVECRHRRGFHGSCRAASP